MQDQNCGRSTADIPVPSFCPKQSERIVGGVNAKPASNPWQVGTDNTVLSRDIKQ